MNLITMPEVGETFNGIVKKVLPNYSLVEFTNGKVGILKKEEVDWCKINDLTSILLVGDSISVKLIEIVNNSKFILSHKVLLNNNQNNTEENNKTYQNQNTYNLPDNI